MSTRLWLYSLNSEAQHTYIITSERSPHKPYAHNMHITEKNSQISAIEHLNQKSFHLSFVARQNLKFIPQPIRPNMKYKP